jgi:hypothetical protein
MRTCLVVIVAALFCFVDRAGAQAQENPGSQSPVRQQEIDRLKRQIDEDTTSSVEAITDYRTQTGDLNNRLDFVRYGGRLNLKSGSSSVFQLTGTRTQYLPISDAFRETGTNFTAGLQTKLSESFAAHLEGGATRFSTDTYSINALASMTYKWSDETHVYVTASRSNVEDSLLSAVGIRPVVGPFAGQLVGRVTENRFVVGGSTHFLGGFDAFGEGGGGDRDGSNVPANFFKAIGGGAGYSIIASPDDGPLSLLRAGYEFNYFGFDENRFGFGGASLLTRGGLPIAPTQIGNDRISPDPGVTRPGVGGYFSPSNFVSNIVRVQAKGGSDDKLSYRVSGFAGSQSYTGAPTGFAKGLSATVSVALTDRVSLPISYFIDNLGPYTQQSVYARLVLKF